ncbi:MAG: hypothetical protein MR024_03835 [Firmicutes bacterium]|nr:hypothetical protein [Bacillota bacterium]
MLKDMPPDKLALFATQIAIDISRGKELDDLFLLRTLIGQISCVMSTIISQKIDLDKRK